MSKRLSRAMVNGNVTVQNVTSGEVMVKVPMLDGSVRTLCIPAHSATELAPKYTSAMLLSRSSNLGTLLHRGVLKIQ